MAKLTKKQQNSVSEAISNLTVSEVILGMYGRQTSDEQKARSTEWLNRRGFSIADAKYGSLLAELIIQGGALTPEHQMKATAMLGKYWRQLPGILAEKRAMEDLLRNPKFDCDWNSIESMITQD